MPVAWALVLLPARGLEQGRWPEHPMRVALEPEPVQALGLVWGPVLVQG